MRLLDLLFMVRHSLVLLLLNILLNFKWEYCTSANRLTVNDDFVSFATIPIPYHLFTASRSTDKEKPDKFILKSSLES